MFEQFDLEEKKSGFVNKYLQVGNHEATITGFTLKESSKGSKQLYFQLEGTPITVDGFTPDESSIKGGQVGNISCGIYADYSDITSDKAKEVGKFCQSVAKRISLKYSDDTYNNVCAIKATTMEDFLTQFVKLVRGKYVFFLVVGEVYGYNETVNKKGEPVKYDKVSLKFARYKYVAESKESKDFEAFDKTNQYHYWTKKDLLETPDTAPSTSAKPNVDWN
jgi:hypothetical protein